jgi:DNA-binding transcriptional regulator YhcF (GntR family)
MATRVSLALGVPRFRSSRLRDSRRLRVRRENVEEAASKIEVRQPVIQIVDAVKRDVGTGRLAPNSVLPCFRVLAEELLVSVITVKRAYEELEREGIIYWRQGLGTFVAEAGHDRMRAGLRASAEKAITPAIQTGPMAGLGRSIQLDVRPAIHADVAFRLPGRPCCVVFDSRISRPAGRDPLTHDIGESSQCDVEIGLSLGGE